MFVCNVADASRNKCIVFMYRYFSHTTADVLLKPFQTQVVHGLYNNCFANLNLSMFLYQSVCSKDNSTGRLQMTNLFASFLKEKDLQHSGHEKERVMSWF